MGQSSIRSKWIGRKPELFGLANIFIRRLIAFGWMMLYWPRAALA